jgi:hypothetical protein
MRVRVLHPPIAARDEVEVRCLGAFQNGMVEVEPYRGFLPFLPDLIRELQVEFFFLPALARSLHLNRE